MAAEFLHAYSVVVRADSPCSAQLSGLCCFSWLFHTFGSVVLELSEVHGPVSGIHFASLTLSPENTPPTLCILKPSFPLLVWARHPKLIYTPFNYNLFNKDPKSENMTDHPWPSSTPGTCPADTGSPRCDLWASADYDPRSCLHRAPAGEGSPTQPLPAAQPLPSAPESVPRPEEAETQIPPG